MAEPLTPEKYGARVRWLRQGQRMSGRDLCRRVEISPAYLSDIEVGRRLPAPEVSDRIAAAVGVDRDDLWRLALLERLSPRDLATLDAARHASDAQVARMAQHIIDCPDLDYDADGDLADVARAALAAAPAPQPAPPGTKGNR